MIHALLLAAALAGDTVRVPGITREFRGVWVATFGNIDWPSARGLPVAQQQQELLAILDRAQQLHLNAVIFQVRPAGDAMYDSQLEPWSEFLTGRQGVAPSPRWDPLAFAVREAHARGLELHAWFNPFRAGTASSGPFSSLHFSRTHPGMVKSYDKLLWMDPGEQEVRDHTVRVVLDVVKRYDIDGVHIDDYFYPYPEHDRLGRLVQFADEPSYNRYRRGGGTLARDDWRRHNVDLVVETLNREIHALKPWVKFGISPFGIYRPGFPAGVEGIDTYQELYADARRWVNLGLADYFSPQLYWPLHTPGQDYSQLLKWWDDQDYLGRHIWPGNFTSRAGSTPEWSASELVSQVMATRADHVATGNVHYSMHALMNNQGGVADQLAARVYSGPALVPASPWMPGETPQAPTVHLVTEGPLRAMACFMEPATPAPRWWVLRVKRSATWSLQVLPGDLRELALGALGPTDTVAVSAVDKTGREGVASLGSPAKSC